MSSLSTRPIKVAPAAAASITLGSGGTPLWTEGPWSEFIAAASAPLCVVGIVVNTTVSTTDAEFEVGIGAAGAETPLTYIHVHEPNPGNGGPSIVMLPAPVSGIGSGMRVAMRVRTNNGLAQWTVALLYTESPDSDHSTSSTPRALPAADVGLSVTPSGTAWANSAWVEVTSGLSADIGVYGVCINQPVPGINIEIDIGIGAAGNETVLTTLRKNTGMSSFTGRVLYVHLPAITLVVAHTRIAFRMRKTGTSTTAHRLTLLYYGDFVTRYLPPITYEDPCAIESPEFFVHVNEGSYVAAPSDTTHVVTPITPWPLDGYGTPKPKPNIGTAVQPNAYTDRLISLWLLQEGPSTWLDYVSRSTAPTIGTPPVVTDQIATFNGTGLIGSNALGNFPNPPNPGPSLTIMIRMQPATLSPSGPYTYFGTANLYGDNSFGFRQQDNKFQWYNAGQSTNPLVTTALQTLAFRQVDGTPPSLEYYYEGAFDSLHGGGWPWPNDTLNPLGIGGTSSWIFNFSGQIDYIAIWSRALSAEEIAQVTIDPYRAFFGATPINYEDPCSIENPEFFVHISGSGI